MRGNLEEISLEKRERASKIQMWRNGINIG